MAMDHDEGFDKPYSLLPEDFKKKMWDAAEFLKGFGIDNSGATGEARKAYLQMLYYDLDELRWLDETWPEEDGGDED